MQLAAGAAEGEAGSEKWADIRIGADGATLSLPVPRDALGDPGTLAVSIAAAREWNEAEDDSAGAVPDIVPDAGTWTIQLDE